MEIDIQLLEQTLISSNEHQLARQLIYPLTEIALYPTQFLKHYQIYRMVYNNPHKPLLYYFGCTSDSLVYLLVNNPQRYIDLAKADGVNLATLEVAIDYATVFLEVTRNMSILVYLVNSVDQIDFFPRPTPEQVQRKNHLTEKYRSIIVPPTGEERENGYMITAYVVRQQQLERHALTISRTGDIESQITVLEQNMPVVMGL